VFTGYLCYYSYLCVYCIQSVNQFVMLLNMDYFSLCMSPTRFGYNKLGLEPIDPLQDRSCRARKQPMGDEKKDDGAGDPIKMLLEEALARKRNEMMDNFTQILRWLPT
jgi:hypothetical protein